LCSLVGAALSGGGRLARDESTPLPHPVSRVARLPHVDSDRARELLERERERVEQAIAALAEDDGQAASEQDEPGELGSEDLYEKEFDTGLAEDLAEQLAAVERAEARLAAGTYGLSVDSGEPIPDARLEARPTAERTVEEQAREP